MEQTPQLIDWDLAASLGAKLAAPGPTVSPGVAARAVADLRHFAGEARGWVADYTGLTAPAEGGSAVVLDRPGWIRANAAGFAELLDPLLGKLAQRRADQPGGRFVGAVGARVSALEAGGLLAFLSSKVLGQYELFASGARTPDSPAGRSGQGRLLLVAPNVVEAEQKMGVDPRDFRLWVCLHEETHRVQFGAVPWLRDHLLEQLRAYLDETEVDPGVLLHRAREAAGSVGGALRSRVGRHAGDDSAPKGDGSLLQAFQTPAQREIVGRISAAMSLLEGHADYVMDGVGPDAVPSVAHIRARFTERRAQAGWLDGVLRRLLGIEAKLRQYRDGERFVRGVVDRVGMTGFNHVWEGPDSLPTPAEVLDPAAWVSRVHAPGVVPA